MDRSQSERHPKRNWVRMMTGTLAAPAALALFAAPTQAGAEKGSEAGGYVSVTLEKEGAATGSALDQMVTDLRRDGQDAARPIVVMLHGFDSKRENGTQDYTHISGKLRRHSERAGMKLGYVGVYWDSHAGDRAKWVLQATGSRLTSLLGMKKAVKNPYLAKCRLAAQVGRSGLRSVFFRLKDEFPQAPIHVVAHSMGAQVVVAALAPQADAKREAEMPTVQPRRAAQLGMVTLAGADLDSDTFTRKDNPALRSALRRADVWWFTVPDKGQADGVLELRRGAGKGDAVGNRGLKLTSEDLNAMLARRALVLDQGNIPAGHAIEDYFNEKRVAAIAASLAYLENPVAQAGQQSLLASLDRVLEADRREVATLASTGDSCVKLYAAWKANTNLSGISMVSVTDRDRRVTPAGMQATR